MPKGVIKSYTNSKDTDKPLQYNGQEKKVKGQTKYYNTMAKRKRSQRQTMVDRIVMVV
jgi:hypothetical protein